MLSVLLICKWSLTLAWKKQLFTGFYAYDVTNSLKKHLAWIESMNMN